MKKLHISDDLSLPLDAVTQKLAFLGRTGSGKTYAAMKGAELALAAGAQIVVLDPVGVWHGLRLGPEPFSIPVFGGLHGDIPLEPSGGALVADLVVDRGISVVLDVSQMIPAEQQRFARGFAARFFQRKKAAPSAVVLIVEECQEFIPENPVRDEAMTLHEFQRLVKLGRNFGIGVWMISQRPQEVAKKALNQTECVFAFQLTGPQEREALARWVADKGLGGDVKALLPKLPVGTAHVWSPVWLDFAGSVRIAAKRTPDVSATPKVGAAARRARDLSPIDVQEFGAAMAAIVERQKAEDPRELRKALEQQKREIGVLEKRVEQLGRELVEAQQTTTPVLSKEDRKALERVGGALLAVIERGEAQSARLAEATAAAREMLGKVRALKERSPPTLGAPILGIPPEHTRNIRVVVREAPQPVAVVALNEQFTTHTTKTAARAERRAAAAGTGAAAVGNGMLRKILIALAQRGDRGLTNRQIGIRAGVSSRSGTFSTYLSKARTLGWVEDRGAMRFITEAGIAALGSFEPLPEGAALLAYWLNELGESGASRILRALSNEYPNALTNDQIGERSGVSSRSGTFSTYMSKLRGLELIEGARGSATMSAELAG